MLLKIGHRLTVDLDHFEGAWLLNKELGHHTHTRTNFQNRNVWTCINGIGYLFSDIQIGQEVLTEILLRTYLFHLGANLQFIA